MILSNFFLRTIILFSLLIICFLSHGQNNNIQYEVNLFTASTKPLDIVYDDGLTVGGAGAGSEITYSTSLQFRFSKSIYKKLYVVGGLAMGTYSFNTTYAFTPSFNQIIQQDPLIWSSTRRGVLYTSLLAGVRYPILANDRNKLFLQIGGTLNYHGAYSLNQSTYAPVTNGEQQKVASTFIVGIKKDRLVFAPDFGIMYQRYFKNEKLGLSIGANMLYSNQTYVKGFFTLYGDDGDITGSFTKRFNLTGATLGVVWKLNKDKE